MAGGIADGRSLPVFGYLTTRSSRNWQRFQEKINQYNDTAFGRFQEAISQVKVVRSFGRVRRELSFFDSQMAQLLKQRRPQSKHWHNRDLFRVTFLNIIFMAAYLIMGIQAANGQIRVEDLVALVQLTALLRMPIFSMSFLVDASQRAISNSKDYFEALDQPIEPASVGQKVLKVSRVRLNLQMLTLVTTIQKS